MKKMASKQTPMTQEEMLPEYDFAGKKGVRGKYHRAYQQGHTVRVHQEDGAVLPEPDVKGACPDSASVNRESQRAARSPAVQQLESLLQETRSFPQVQELTEEDIAAEVAAYRSGQ